ncbi:LysR family transcriptional regulator [Sorangium cellulosum]|uniref:LysR family transcriptional regulator n=1 Tax=Sorangium cellulosum TaxID=56 RepID=A0A150P907_SORCE|nr:LysR family transcriptional regulator [Sorangium cellulosum]
MHGCMARSRASAPAGRPLADVDWGDLRLFLEVARAGSFSAAARKRGIEQSTVSRRMAAFERALRAAVFDRRPGGSMLTPLGEQLRRHVEAMEAGADQLVRDASGHEKEVEGLVRLALTESIAVHAVIPRVLPVLAEKHPRVSLHLLTSYEAADLGHRDAEIALRFFRPRSGDLVAARVVTLPTVPVAHRRLSRKGRDELDWIGVDLGRIAAVEDDYQKRHVRKAPRLVVGSYIAQIEAVRAGLGAAVLPRSALALDDDLVELDLGLPAGPVLELWLVTPRSLRQVPRIAAVWSALEEQLQFLGDPRRGRRR